MESGGLEEWLGCVYKGCGQWKVGVQGVGPRGGGTYIHVIEYKYRAIVINTCNTKQFVVCR